MDAIGDRMTCTTPWHFVACTAPALLPALRVLCPPPLYPREAAQGGAASRVGMRESGKGKSMKKFRKWKTTDLTDQTDRVATEEESLQHDTFTEKKGGDHDQEI
jgi:hypothetical protein